MPAKRRGRKPRIEDDTLREFLPHGCRCKDREDATACSRCRENRERIRRLYEKEEQNK